MQITKPVQVYTRDTGELVTTITPAEADALFIESATVWFYKGHRPLCYYRKHQLYHTFQ